MKNHQAALIGFIVVAISFIVGAYFYPQLPTTIAAHWNAQGVANGFMGKFWGVFMLPIISLVIFVIFMIIPIIDPRHENIEKFRHQFHLFMLFMLAFFLYLEGLVIFYNLGAPFNMVRLLAPAIAVLFFAVGSLLSHARRNWFVGIRTPWTLESETVWNKTHALGGTLFKIAAFVALVGLVFPAYTFWFVVVPVIAFAVWTIVYSYVEYQREQRMA
jgi:uncharacterized membrane protein